jgi:hypothetical protein
VVQGDLGGKWPRIWPIARVSEHVQRVLAISVRDTASFAKSRVRQLRIRCGCNEPPLRRCALLALLFAPARRRTKSPMDPSEPAPPSNTAGGEALCNSEPGQTGSRSCLSFKTEIKMDSGLRWNDEREKPFRPFVVTQTPNNSSA